MKVFIRSPCTLVNGSNWKHTEFRSRKEFLVAILTYYITDSPPSLNTFQDT